MVGTLEVFAEGLAASHQRTDISYRDMSIKCSLNDFILFTELGSSLLTNEQFGH